MDYKSEIAAKLAEITGLESEQGGGHQQELRDLVQVLPLHFRHVLHILVGHFCDRDIVDVDIVFFDQMKQKVQRTFKLAKSDLWILQCCHFILPQAVSIIFPGQSRS